MYHPPICVFCVCCSQKHSTAFRFYPSSIFSFVAKVVPTWRRRLKYAGFSFFFTRTIGCWIQSFFLRSVLASGCPGKGWTYSPADWPIYTNKLIGLNPKKMNMANLANVHVARTICGLRKGFRTGGCIGVSLKPSSIRLLPLTIRKVNLFR